MNQSIENLYSSLAPHEEPNPYFQSAPPDAILKNNPQDEKPIIYTNEEYLTPKQLELQEPLTAEQLYDMFSFLVGGKLPSLQELGTSWEKLANHLPDKKRLILDFIRNNPKQINLLLWLSQELQISATTSLLLSIHHPITGRQQQVLVAGQISTHRNIWHIYHPIRNLRRPIHGPYISPCKADGYLPFQNYEAQIVYEDNQGKTQLRRLNTIVFLLARQGITEETRDGTPLDQVYITPGEYVKYIFPTNPQTRKQYQTQEEQNFLISKGDRRAIRQKLEQVVTTIENLANTQDWQAWEKAIRDSQGT